MTDPVPGSVGFEIVHIEDGVVVAVLAEIAHVIAHQEAFVRRRNAAASKEFDLVQAYGDGELFVLEEGLEAEGIEEEEISIFGPAGPVAIDLDLGDVHVRLAELLQQGRDLLCEDGGIRLLPDIVNDENGRDELDVWGEWRALVELRDRNGRAGGGVAGYVEHFYIELLGGEGVDGMEAGAIRLVTLFPEVEPAGGFAGREQARQRRRIDIEGEFGHFCVCTFSRLRVFAFARFRGKDREGGVIVVYGRF